MTIQSKIRMFLSAIILLSFSLGLFVIYPLFRGIQNVSRQFLAQRQVLAATEVKLQNLEDFEKNYENFRLDLDKAEKTFVSAQLPVDFIVFLEKASNSGKVSVKISPSVPTQDGKDPWLSSRFKLSLAGAFPNILRFLEELENSQYLIRFQGLNISRLEESSDVKADLTLKVFVK